MRHVGEPVAGVVAGNRYQAEDAAALIAIEYEPLPLVVDPEQAVRAGAPLLHDEAGTNVIVSREFKRGDVEAASASAAVRVTGRFRMHRKSPVAIEPRCYLAEYEPGRDALTLHSATQVPGIVRDALSSALDMPPDRLRVIAADVGGGFGGKGSLYPEEIFVCAAARLLQRPVKWTGDRLEELVAGSQGFDEIIRRRIGARRRWPHRRLAGRRDRRRRRLFDLSVDRGARAGTGRELLPGPYRVQNYRGRVQAVATSKAPTGPYRGVGRPISTFVMERLMDMAAAKLGIDAKDIRLRNLIADDELPYKVASGIVWDKSGFHECLHKACAAIGYDTLRAKQKEARAAGRWVGIGIACYAELTGIGSRISVAPGMPINTGTETAIVRVEPHRRVHRHVRYCVARPRPGDDARASRRRTSRRPLRRYPRPAGRQRWRARRHRHLCQPQHGACRRRRDARGRKSARQKMLNAASHLLEASAADLVAEDGKIFVAGADRSITFREVARAVYAEMGRLPPDARGELAATETYDPVFGTTTSATHIAMVETIPKLLKSASSASPWPRIAAGWSIR